jgi:transcriptional regulator with XRE-family HTH domain
LGNSKNNKMLINPVLMSQVRLDLAMSMDEVASKVGCNKAKISRWERGILTPSDDWIEKLIECYGTKSFVVVKAGTPADFLLEQVAELQRQNLKLRGAAK